MFAYSAKVYRRLSNTTFDVTNIVNLVLGAFLIFGAVSVALSTSWLAENLARAEAERDAAHWQSRVLDILEKGVDTFEHRAITPQDKKRLESFLSDAFSFRYVLFDKDGVAFASSLEKKVGSKVDFEKQEMVFRDGQIVHLLARKFAHQIDQAFSQHKSVAANEERIVSEIYMPVRKDGRVIGAIEHYRDDTETIVWAKDSLNTLALAIGGFMAFLAAIFLVSQRGAEKKRAEAISKAHQLEVISLEKQAEQSREQQLLSELNDWLQSCSSLEELFEMVSAFMSKLFPNNPGSINVYSNSRDVLVHACCWSGGEPADHVSPQDCWSLRRGRAYTYGNNEVDFVCAHVGPDAPSKYVCIPIVAHGETVGLLHLRHNNCEKTNFDKRKRLAILCAEHISLAIANVRLRDQLHAQTIRDSLTGLYNRRYFMDTCRRVMDRAKKNKTSFCLISIDVDHFKAFNDNHGHDAGDVVLRHVGEMLENQCGPTDFPCRLGGEEFVILASEADPVAAKLLAENLRFATEQISIKYGSNMLPSISISVGISAFPHDGSDPQALLQSSDEALYKAKNEGRNRVAMSAGAAQEVNGHEVFDIAQSEQVAAMKAILDQARDYDEKSRRGDDGSKPSEECSDSSSDEDGQMGGCCC